MGSQASRKKRTQITKKAPLISSSFKTHSKIIKTEKDIILRSTSYFRLTTRCLKSYIVPLNISCYCTHQ